MLGATGLPGNDRGICVEPLFIDRMPAQAGGGEHCRAIVERRRGCIWATSSTAQGAALCLIRPGRAGPKSMALSPYDHRSPPEPSRYSTSRTTSTKREASSVCLAGGTGRSMSRGLGRCSAADRRLEVGPRSARVSVLTSDTPDSPFLSSCSCPDGTTRLVSVKTRASLGSGAVLTTCARVHDPDLSKVYTKRKICPFRPDFCLDRQAERCSSICPATFVYPERDLCFGEGGGFKAFFSLLKNQ